MIQPSIPPSVQRLIDLATQWLERSLTGAPDGVSMRESLGVLAVDVEPYELLPGIYRHFKGGLYTVALVARQEGDNKRVVVYQGSLGVWWTRPFDEFTGIVQTAEGSVRRFVRVSP